MINKIENIISRHRPFPETSKYDTYVDESWISKCAKEIESEVLKNMESSSRVIHSQPTEGYTYHVKFQPSDDYELAFCHIHHKELQFKFFNGGRCNIETVSEWIPEPIIFIKG